MNTTFEQRWKYALSMAHPRFAREAASGIATAVSAYFVLRFVFGSSAAEQEVAAIIIAFLVGVVALPSMEFIWHLWRAADRLRQLAQDTRLRVAEDTVDTLQTEVARLNRELEARPFIQALRGQVRYTAAPRRFPYAGVKVNTEGGVACRKVRGRLMRVESSTGQQENVPGGLLQWSAFDGGLAECDIDAEAWLDVVTVEHPNWATIVYADNRLRNHNNSLSIFSEGPSEFMLTISFGGENCAAVTKRFLLTVGAPLRTRNSEGVETIWIYPGWLPPVTFEALDEGDDTIS